jgi:hypothetical protein
MAANGDWENLLRSCQNEWFRVDILKRQEMSTMAAHAAWHMSQWKKMGMHAPPLLAALLRIEWCVGRFVGNVSCRVCVCITPMRR